jgi:azurin
MTAQTGSQVELTFNNNAVNQQHNWVLVQNGTKDQVATAGLAAGQDNNWVAPSDTNVVANAPLLAAGESASVNFVAPAAGTYQFVCTFPGHNMTMFGTFEVTP